MPRDPLILHQGRTLTLRRSTPEDAPLLYAKLYNNRDFSRLFRLNDTVNSEQELCDRLARRLQQSPEKTGYVEVMVSHAEFGQIGLAALAGYSKQARHSEMLIGFFEEVYWNVMYGVELSLLLADLAFNAYDHHRLYAYVYGYNEPAQASLALWKEGVMKDHVFDTEGQQFVDLNVYGVTLPNFRQDKRIAKLSKRLVGRDITQPLSRKKAPPPSPKPQEKPMFTPSGSIVLSPNRDLNF